ncbi:MAG: hypothetical protein ACRELC_05825 [Gemmatimonadota bacterium]
MFGHTVSERLVPRGRRAALVAALAVLPLVGCEETLEVENQDVLTPDAVSVELLVAGATRDFNVAYSGGGLDDKFITMSALITDEVFSSGTFTTRTATDQRNQFAMAQGNTSDAAYNDLHTARRAALRAFDALGAAGQGSSADATRMKLYEGYSYVALGEGYCSGIPFSEVTPEDERIPGQPISTQEIFQQAVTIFDAALAIDGGNNAASVGKGRALLNLGDYPGAAAAVAGVPTDFLFAIDHSANSGDQENPLFNLQSNGRYSLSDVEGGNGLPFRSAGDPRVPWVENPAGGFDSSIRLFLSQKYSEDRASPVVLADGVEARLIEAEAALNAGDAAGFITILNALRADVATLMAARILNYSALVPGPNNPSTTLPPLADPGSAVGREDLLFSERGFWMWGTGHRLGDFRRLIRQYGRGAETVYPTGAYHKSGTYGADIVLPLDFDETNNPNYSEDLCVYTSP